ncbi:hypothetical protein NIB75_05580 [Bacteroides uniformis]|nr:hypothetical protein [Bacteroides uniformis]
MPWSTGEYTSPAVEIFHFGPMYGTNNIGEFLAIVHGLALLKQKGFDMPIYSDSVNAINWIKQKKCKTKLPRDAKTEELFRLIERAEKWLRENTYTTRILKWETKQWGEIPADFGRRVKRGHPGFFIRLCPRQENDAAELMNE